YFVTAARGEAHFPVFIRMLAPAAVLKGSRLPIFQGCFDEALAQVRVILIEDILYAFPKEILWLVPQERFIRRMKIDIGSISPHAKHQVRYRSKEMAIALCVVTRAVIAPV